MLLLGIELGHELPLGGIQNLRPATLAPARPRRVQPGLGALAHQVALELGQGAEHVKHQLAAAGTGIDLLLHAHQADAHLVELSAEQDQVVQRPPQPIEPPDRQHITDARHFQRHGEARAGRLRATYPVLVDFLAPGQAQRIPLQVE